MMQRMADTACEMTVARAAPYVARPNLTMKSRSRPMLSADENSRKIRGILLLPIALMSDAQ